MYGFRLVNGLLEVVPEEAEIIRLFADLYLEGYGYMQLSRALERAGIHGRFGRIMRGKTLLGVIFNEKTHGDLLLQKRYINNPLDKKHVKNKGERQQYFVADSHEPIIDRETRDLLLAERARRAEKYLPEKSRGQRVYPLTRKIVCGHCGAFFQRKSVYHGKDCKIVWMCGTYKHKGKAHCNAKQIPEDIIMDAAARTLGLSTFDGDIFNRMISTITAPEDGVVIFSFYDGREVRVEWENKSRRESWTPEMREKARAKTLEGLQRNRGVVQ